MDNSVYLILLSLGCGGCCFGIKTAAHRTSGWGKKMVHAILYLCWLLWTIAGGWLLFSSALQLSAGSSGSLSAGGWAPPLGIALVMDQIALFGLFLVLIVGSASIFFSLGDRSIPPEVHFFSYFFLAACQGVLLAADLFTLFVFFEIIAISAYILIAAKKYPRAVLAGFRYLLLASTTIFLYLVGVFVVYRATGSLAIPAASTTALFTKVGKAVTAAAIVAGMASRMAIFPFHGWLPEAHSQAIHPVSALLSGLLIKIPLLVLLRMSHLFSADFLPQGAPLFLYSGLFTALFGAFMALIQRDAKKLLAYSSISQMGLLYATFGAGLFSSGSFPPYILAALLLHAFSHALFKPLLFLSVGSICDRSGSRDLLKLRGAVRYAGWWFPLCLAGIASLAGIPLFGGYLSKQALSGTMYSIRIAQTALVLASCGTVAYCLKLSAIFLPDRSSLASPAPGQKPGLARYNYPGLAAAALLALGIIVSGTAPLFTNAITASLAAAAAYTLTGTVKQVLIIAGGAALYLLFSTPVMSALTRKIRALPLAGESALSASLLGFAVSFFLLLLRA
jgi:formate hydrogenlyase subunit 3/multisubunit Na+/H+ antiporter MnhD subunit